MKKLIFQCVGILALAANLEPAGAADMPVKARPLAPAIYDWSGFYIGVHGGGGWGSIGEEEGDWEEDVGGGGGLNKK